MLLNNDHYFTINAKFILTPHLYPTLDSTALAWVGIAHFDHTDNVDSTMSPTLNGTTDRTPRGEQIAVRQLLTQMLTRLNLVDVLQQEAFPYRLQRTGFYVCFSHSNQQVSCIISTMPSAIDSELKPITQGIAKRYYHYNELNWLSAHPCNQSTDIKTKDVKDTKDTNAPLAVLWMLKECGIKMNAPHHINLRQGLKQDYSAIAAQLLSSKRFVCTDKYIDTKFIPNLKIKISRKTSAKATSSRFSEFDKDRLFFRKGIIYNPEPSRGTLPPKWRNRYQGFSYNMITTPFCTIGAYPKASYVIYYLIELNTIIMLRTTIVSTV